MKVTESDIAARLVADTLRAWSSGKILAFQASDPGSIPGARIFVFRTQVRNAKVGA